MAITKGILGELLKDYKGPENISGKDGLAGVRGVWGGRSVRTMLGNADTGFGVQL